MRQNLTNVSSVDINSVDHFYVVGSTTKEGLIEGKSNVKIDLKNAVAGGGTSSEDAEKIYEVLFGQMPYVFIPEVSLVPVALPEAVTSVNPDVSGSFSDDAFYKKKEPLPAKALYVGYDAGSDSWTISFYKNDGIFVAVPEETVPGGPWYTFVPADVDLSEFPAPEVLGDPVPLTGMELPIQPTLKIFHIEAGLREYTKITEDTTFYKCVVRQDERQIVYTIEEVEGVWTWKAEDMIS